MRNSVNILIANDDGVAAPGILALAEALQPLGRVVIVAPESERSGFSSALTLDRPLMARQVAKDVWSVNGTPADAVYLALNGLFDFQFDLLVSGINSGANLADYALYSGTVGAAFAGRNLVHSALAISLAGAQVKAYTDKENFRQAAAWVHDFIAQGIAKLPSDYIFNINIPDVTQIEGMQYTYPSRRSVKQALHIDHDPHGRDVYWITLAGTYQADVNKQQQGYISDVEALQQSCVSLTPLQIANTELQILNELQASCAGSAD